MKYNVYCGCCILYERSSFIK
uniref:Uncharacterized protein n=1 Tax=Anguilla anguilla TaxID=7936 RepID=A0A0E9Q5A4_ANGAN